MLLTLLIGLPFLTAVLVACLPRGARLLYRPIVLLAMFFTCLLSVLLFLRFEAAPAVDGFKFTVFEPWVESLGISFHLGVDGINVGLLLLAGIVSFAAACVASEIRSNEKTFYVLFLVMVGGILGAFASLDLFFFYFFHELALVPTFLMIGLWGRGENRTYATFNITLYLSLGALIALVGLIAIYLQLPAVVRTFDLVEITKYFRANPMAQSAQNFIFPFLMFGFGILVSLWPFHTWAPLGYGAAPSATSMLHAGVLKKFGLYGLIRVALPWMPDAARHWLPVLALLCLGNILYCGWVAMRQRDLNLLIGNSSVAHMGFVFLGIASLNLLGVTGAILVMIAHGFLAALLFGLSGYLYQQTATLEMSQLGGLLKRLPFIGTAMVMAMMAGCGLPGFANFAGEITVLFGAWNSALPHAQRLVAVAAWGALVVGAVYMLRAVRAVLHGEISPKWTELRDATAWNKVPFGLLLAALLLFGIRPGLLSEKIKPSAESILKMATTTSLEKGGGPKALAAP